MMQLKRLSAIQYVAIKIKAHNAYRKRLRQFALVEYEKDYNQRSRY